MVKTAGPRLSFKVMLCLCKIKSRQLTVLKMKYKNNLDFYIFYYFLDPAGFDAFGEVMKPQSSLGQDAAPKSQEKLSGKDLDSSLVELAGSLAINGSSNKVK